MVKDLKTRVVHEFLFGPHAYACRMHSQDLLAVGSCKLPNCVSSRTFGVLPCNITRRSSSHATVAALHLVAAI